MLESSADRWAGNGHGRKVVDRADSVKRSYDCAVELNVAWEAVLKSAIPFILIAGLYFLPTLIGVIRAVPNQGSVLVVNLFLGWTFIGWVVALAMAARSGAAENHVHVAQTVAPESRTEDPGLNAAVAKAIADYESQRAAKPPPPDSTHI